MSCVLVHGGGTAHAQPGQWAPPPQPSRAVVLTADEQSLLLRGEISEGEHIAGGLLGTFMGYGLGHAAQGRWSDKGWIFTTGEIASLAVLLGAAVSCTEGAFEGRRVREDRCAVSIVGSALAFAGLRIWEIVDVWAGPGTHNRKVQQLRMRTGQPPMQYGFYVAPTSSSSGVAGLSVRF